MSLGCLAAAVAATGSVSQRVSERVLRANDADSIANEMSKESSTRYLDATAGVLTGIALGSLAMTMMQLHKRQQHQQLPSPEPNAPLTAPKKKTYPEELKEEMFSRVRTFFGDEGLKKLSNSFVVVVGLGGVGSHCAHMLVRSGIGRIRLIDFDQVTLSSLNRHAVATMADVGISKAAAMKQHLQSIVPWCEIEDCNEMFLMKEADRLLSGKPDLVLDCIDDVNTKAELIAYCLQHNLPVLTSMGAGGKADPTKLRIAPLSDCINDPLAQKIKWKLKKHNISADQVMTVFSVEKPVAELLPLDEEQKNAPQEFGAVDYLRIRVIPVLGTSPSIFGQAMASYGLCSIAGKMYHPEGGERMSKSLKHKLRQVFKNNEKERFGVPVELSESVFNDEDLEFVVQQVWQSRCAITHRRFGGTIMLTLTRWDASQPPSPYNCVLMMQQEAKHLLEQGPSYFSEETQGKIAKRLEWAKKVFLQEIEPFHYGPQELYWPEAFQNFSQQQKQQKSQQLKKEMSSDANSNTGALLIAPSFVSYAYVTAVSIVATSLFHWYRHKGH